MTSIRRILYATDLSQASDAAWAMAQVVGRLFDAEIVALTLVARIVTPAVEYLPPQVIDEALAAADRAAREGLARFIEGRVPPTLRVRRRVEGGPAVDGIVDTAREEGAALIVMGTHGRTGLGRVVLGSVADRVVRLAPCPVLTVRARPDALSTARPIRRICPIRPTSRHRAGLRGPGRSPSPGPPGRRSTFSTSRRTWYPTGTSHPRSWPA